MASGRRCFANSRGIAYREVKLWPVAERDRFVTELWKSGMLEEGGIVCHLYRRFAKSCGEREFRMFEQWIDRYVRNWSHCDGVSTWLIAASIANQAGIGGQAGWLDEIEESMEAAIGGGFVDPGSQAAAATPKQSSTFAVCCLTTPTTWCKRVSAGCSKKPIRRGRAKCWSFWIGWRARAPRLVLRLAAEKMTREATTTRWLLTKVHDWHSG